MTDPYVSFDTFTIDEHLRQQDAKGPTPQAPSAPVLVKIPRLKDRDPSEATIQAPPEPLDTPAVEEETRLRVDAAMMAHARQVPPPPEVEPTLIADGAAVVSRENESPGLLLSLQPVVATHSRWIALLVTLAVVVLALVLLRSEAPSYQDATPISPLSDDQGFGAQYAETDDLKSIDDAEPWLDTLAKPPSEEDQQDADGLAANGPVSSPRVAAPRARLAGKIEAPGTIVADAQPKSPRLLGQLPEQEADDVSGYPRTANSDPAWIQPENENVIR